MSQKKVTEYFLNRKRSDACQPTKRQKTIGFEVLSNTEANVKVQSSRVSAVAVQLSSEPPSARNTRCKPTKPTVSTSRSKPVVPATKSQLGSTVVCDVERSVSVTTAVSDSTPVSSPSKRSSSQGPCNSLKRGRIPTDDVQQTSETFNFTPYRSELAQAQQPSSPRRRLVLRKQIAKESSVFCFKGCESVDEGGNATPSSAADIIESEGKCDSNDNVVDGGASNNLGKCKNLAELKQKLAQFQDKKAAASKALERAQHAVSKQNALKIQSTRNTDNKATPSTDVINIDQVQPLVEVSVLKPLSKSVSQQAVNFKLPYRYQLLGETFQSTDTVVSLLHNRNEICTFGKLKVAVQEMTKRLFEISHLGQIKTVYPTAYRFQQERDLPIYGGKSSDYQLTVSAILRDSESASNDPAEIQPIFTAAKLLERKKLFLQNLTNTVKHYHQEFLKKLNVRVGDDDIKRWHPKFDLEKVPDILPAELPQPPEVKKFSTAQDVLDEVKDKLNPRIHKALEIVAGKAQSDVTKPALPTVDPTEAVLSPSRTVITPAVADRLNAFKGIPQSLLERVRAKQAEKQEREMQRSTNDSKKLEMLQRLPELTRILREHFVALKRPAIPFADVVKSFSGSYKSALGAVEAENHLKLMAEVVPDWVNIVQLKSGSFVKVNRDIDLASVHNKINACMKTL